MSRPSFVEIRPEEHEGLEEDDVDKVPSYLCCPVCLELFTEPRLLPCSHTVCQTCLKSIESIGVHHTGGQWPPSCSRLRITCPVCRNVASCGAADMPCNRALLDVIKDWKSRATLRTLDWVKTRITKCRKHDCQKADLWCAVCKYNMCAQCSESHEHKKDSMSKIADFSNFTMNRSKIIGIYISNIPKVTEFFENIRLLNRSQIQLVKDHHEWQKQFGDFQLDIHNTIDDRFDRLQQEVNSEFNKMFERICHSRRGGFKCLHNLQTFLTEANQKLPDIKKLDLYNDILLATIDSFISTITSRLTKRTVDFSLLSENAVGKVTELKDMISAYKFHTGPNPHHNGGLQEQRARGARHHRARRNEMIPVESLPPNNGQGNENTNNNNNYTDHALPFSNVPPAMLLQQQSIDQDFHLLPFSNGPNVMYGYPSGAGMPWQLPQPRISAGPQLMPVIPADFTQGPVMPFHPPHAPAYYQRLTSPPVYTYQPWMMQGGPISAGTSRQYPQQHGIRRDHPQPHTVSSPHQLHSYQANVSPTPREIHATARTRRHVQTTDNESISVAQINQETLGPQAPQTHETLRTQGVSENSPDDSSWMSDSENDEDYIELWRSLLLDS